MNETQGWIAVCALLVIAALSTGKVPELAKEVIAVACGVVVAIIVGLAMVAKS